MQEVAKGILVETDFRGITVAAIHTSEGFILIDAPSFPNEAQIWRSMLQNYADSPIIALVMMDSHRDRLLGGSWFRPEIIIAHSATQEALNNFSNSYISTVATLLTTSSNEQMGLLAAKILPPTVIFTHQMRLYFGGRELRFYHQPGPTRGSMWVHCVKENVLLAGDTVVVDTPPYLNSPHSKDWIQALFQLRQKFLDTLIIVPGRGHTVVDKNALEPLLNYLQLARQRIKDLYESRRSLSETVRIIHDLLMLFPPPLEYELEEIQQRVRTGLQFIYNEFREQELGIMETNEFTRHLGE